MSGSRVDVPDEELAKEWPYLTRAQLEEYKDAFKIFDRRSQGLFTGADVEWVMRSLGQTPTEKQIEAIIRDMDLDNDGVIDLAEFMIRMMALTSKAAPEEDLKHVFDVLDRGNEGHITADSLRSAIKSIGDWEMTDDEIEVAIKLADKSGDGNIDYNEFIAFVFGESEPARQKAEAGTGPVASTSQAGLTDIKDAVGVDQSDLSFVQQQHYTAQEYAAPDHIASSASMQPLWHDSSGLPGTSHNQTASAHSTAPWLAGQAANTMPGAQTDDWAAARTQDTSTMDTSQYTAAQPHVLYENQLFQPEATSTMHAAAPELLDQQQQQQQQQETTQSSHQNDTQHDQQDSTKAPSLASDVRHEQPVSQNMMQQDLATEPSRTSSWHAEAQALHAHAQAAAVGGPEQQQQQMDCDLLDQHCIDIPDAQAPLDHQESYEAETSHSADLRQQAANYSAETPLQANVPHRLPQPHALAATSLSAAPLPRGKRPAALPKHPAAPNQLRPRHLPALSSAQLSAGINRSKKPQERK